MKIDLVTYSNLGELEALCTQQLTKNERKIFQFNIQSLKLLFLSQSNFNLSL